MSHFSVTNGGILSLLQDAGRYGYSHIGLTSGGPLDSWSFRWANQLLQNPLNATAIEISVGGLQLAAETDSFICLCGAEMPLHINGQAVALWTVHRVRKGDHITIGMTKHGLRGYLAVAGGFQIPQQFGSNSTVVREGVGGINGGKLAAGDRLPVNTGITAVAGLSLPPRLQPRFTSTVVLRLIEGYQAEYFTPQQRLDFYQAEYRVSNQADRMGYKLQGTAITCQQQQLLSEGICYGAVQIPPDGQPIVLLNDRQTLGGYPKIGTVLSTDLWQLAQARSGSSVYFMPVTPEYAIDALNLNRIYFNALIPQLVNT